MHTVKQIVFQHFITFGSSGFVQFLHMKVVLMENNFLEFDNAAIYQLIHLLTSHNDK